MIEGCEADKEPKGIEARIGEHSLDNGFMCLYKVIIYLYIQQSLSAQNK